MALEDSFPHAFSTADTKSRNEQRLLLWLTGALLGLSLLAAVFGTFSISSGKHDYAGLGSLLALLGGITLSLALAYLKPNKGWYDFRALAESAKTLNWMYSVGGGDFALDGSASDARNELQRRLAELEIEFGRTCSNDTWATTSEMDATRNSNLEARRSLYRDERLIAQREWYARKSSYHKRSAMMLSALSIVAQAVGVVFAYLRFDGVIHVDLVGVAATAAAAAVAWTHARDHSGVAEAYTKTVSELIDAGTDLSAATTEKEWALAVANAEVAMSREHTSWVARRRDL